MIKGSKTVTIKQIRAISGLSQAKFAAKYHIPRRTLENWEASDDNPDQHPCPVYVLEMLERIVKEDFPVQKKRSSS